MIAILERSNPSPLGRPTLARILLVATAVLGSATLGFADETVTQVHDLGSAWSGHPVGFYALTQGGRQYVAYYDADRRLTVAERALDSSDWTFTRLDARVGWDSHNSIMMALDRRGHLHLSGNMHVAPLVYFRGDRPHEASSLRPVHRMIGDREERCTYPRFLDGPDGALVFTYRDGKSGDGSQIFNVHDEATGQWRRLLDTPLFDGEGRRNAYLRGPEPGPDGFYHLLWVWRETPDCATNHDLGYARSRDLVHWENAHGAPLTVPIRLDAPATVDPVPEGAGLINGGASLGFDANRRPIVAYHKYDPDGLTQAYTARVEADRWVVRQASRWSYRWDFHGGGSIGSEVGVDAPRPGPDGTLLVSYRHIKEGAGTLVLDAGSLEPTGRTLPRERPWPRQLDALESPFPGMRVHVLPAGRHGSSRYFLRWETLGPNRDRPRDPPLPEPSPLRLFECS